MPAGTLIVPAPVTPKMAPSPAALFQAVPVQLRSAVFQMKVPAPLSQVLSPARASALAMWKPSRLKIQIWGGLRNRMRRSNIVNLIDANPGVPARSIAPHSDGLPDYLRMLGSGPESIFASFRNELPMNS